MNELAIEYLTGMKKANKNIISNLHEIIQMCEKKIELSNLNENVYSDKEERTLYYYNNMQYICQKMLVETEISLININNEISCCWCCHEFVRDTIDIGPERTMDIVYCELCEYTKHTN